MPLNPFYVDRLPMLAEVERLGDIATPEGARAWDLFWASADDGYTAPQVQVEQRLVTSPTGAPPVPIRIYRPLDGRTNGTGLVWVHGGGFTGGSIDMFESEGVARELVHRSGGIVVTVDYRLADAETTYPAPVDDVLAVWRWARDAEAELGADAEHLALGGGSAGSVLASSATAILRDAGEPVPRLLVLIYPVAHAVIPPLSHELAAKMRPIPAPLNYTRDIGTGGASTAFHAYLGGPAWMADGHSFVGHGDLAGFPPTVIVNCEYDGLRASGQRLASQLAEAGVDVIVRNEPGMLHGHINFPPVIEPIAATLRTMAGAMASMLTDAG